jgi:hypothetical protein
VAIASKLATGRAVIIETDSAWVTETAADSLRRLGLATDALRAPGDARRLLCRPCMDWSEQRLHLAGRLGAAICSGCLSQGWLRRKPQSRALEITPLGQVELSRWMGLDLWRTIVA